jgi:hypothetical protein
VIDSSDNITTDVRDSVVAEMGSETNSERKERKKIFFTFHHVRNK